ncbi:hypothetical protein H0Z60_14840 [Ectothiorhodospiraceae bacterium WFHF3C12]|nr:hypothetical protein [Ectothiorhodospiraceae bacterium WFHF3C12]
MEVDNQDLQGLVRAVSRDWQDLELPPVTDWDLFEVLLEAMQHQGGDRHARQAVLAALLAARSKLAQAGNAERVADYLAAIDDHVVRLRAAAH